MNNVNVEIFFLNCRNYINQMEKSCNFFKWLCDEIVNERDLKLKSQNKKNFKLKDEVVHIRALLKISMVFDIFSLMLNALILTLYFK